MATSRPGHSYSNIYNSDASRSHLGDVYNQYGPSLDQQAFRAVLDSLRYDGMDNRRDRLNSAERGTFEWALAGRDVTSTVDRDDESDGGNEHHDAGSQRGSDSGDDDDEKSTSNEDEDVRHNGNKEERDGSNGQVSGSGDGEGSTNTDDDEKNADKDDDEDSADEYHLWYNTKNIDQAFMDWLVSDEKEDKLFCFMGKPGSGKSTLM